MPGKFDDNIYRTVFLSFNVGRHLKITKKKVEWGMLYNNQEHVVMLKQSIITGKKQIYLDKRVIFEDSKMLEIQFNQEIAFDGMHVVISCEIKDKEIIHHLSINEKPYESLPYLNRAQVANAQRYNRKIIPACLLYDVPPGENISMFEASKTDQAVERAKAYLEDSSSDEEEENDESSSDDDDSSSSDEDKKKKKSKSKKSKKAAKKNNKKKSKDSDDDSSSSDDDDDDDSSSDDSSEDESRKKKKQLAKKKALISQRKKSMPAAILTQRKKTMPATIKPRAKSTVKKVTWAENIGDDDDEDEDDDDDEYVVTRINKKKVKVPLKHSKFISRSSGEESSSDEEDLPKNRKPIKKMTKKNIPKAPAIEKPAAQDDFDDLFA